MLRNNDLKSNVLMEITQKTNSWKNLRINHPNPKIQSIFEINSSTSRNNSKENIRIDTKSVCRPFTSQFSNSGSQTHRNQSTNSRENLTIEKQLETIENNLSDINKLKNQLNHSYREKREELSRREKELLDNEQEFNKKYSAFEEERDKCCIHISLKLNEIKKKEVELELSLIHNIDKI